MCLGVLTATGSDDKNLLIIIIAASLAGVLLIIIIIVIICCICGARRRKQKKEEEKGRVQINFLYACVYSFRLLINAYNLDITQNILNSTFTFFSHLAEKS